ncbi:flavodoxin-dependent (E)-4-hydroxy-3-methylbut-2-enyl-diphosphate synthase [Acidimicrobiaceae bacterium]|jgi:(E)-4-hydroxy-3-methylbut-2-enyl-diphosphate synthase|nr:flavodoxin-dependent (E)-4-hydroxy-3-methylbut-2-enyl-diphosphate synthase [bacterium]MDA9727347.1 flavodoxin-dependent (E)-4-hydroxy-3-methylbut-2-enyl-diphosphate synthase [Acidimicrobiaceae bacterium]GIR90600.1 MAG: 4-hydroxy-3-methylbut-2-en-1-yl diphosphate synthase (flavodoxin) [Actinomycetota bacterium]|tara:strand:- start:305 stop:1528 length:1224 start_codon:yes stop_codon:yes gene_type:complete
MKFNRRKTRQIQIGKVGIGSDFPISVQSMTTTKTKDVESTLSQIYELASNGADIVRVTCNEVDAATGLVEITQRSPVPIVADVHFQYKLALAAIDAGVNGLRLNPGNIRKEQQIKEVAKEALSANIPIRIGVNGGSLDKDLLEKYGDATPEALVESALKELKYLEDVGFFDIKISVKHSNVPLMIESYRLLAEKVDYPLHLGVTEAGPLPGGLIKSTAGIGTLLSEGIGDTIRYSLTTDPVEEAKSGRALLEYLGLRERNSLDLIACPSCGRAEVDVIKVAEEAQDALNNENIPLQVAVMGCVVNGPGEARSADLGIAAGKNKGHLFIKGEVVRVVNEKEMVDALLSEAKLIIEQGIDARLAAADKNAAEIARKDANDLINSQGDINNFLERKKSVVEISSNTDIEN